MLPHPLHPSVAFLYPLKILSCFKSVFWTKTLKFKLFRRYLKRSKKRALLLSPCSAKFLRLFFLKITMQLVQEFLKFLEALMYVTALSCIYFCFAWKGTLRPENFVTCHIVFFKYVPLLTIFFYIHRNTLLNFAAISIMIFLTCTKVLSNFDLLQVLSWTA